MEAHPLRRVPLCANAVDRVNVVEYDYAFPHDDRLGRCRMHPAACQRMLASYGSCVAVFYGMQLLLFSFASDALSLTKSDPRSRRIATLAALCSLRACARPGASTHGLVLEPRPSPPQ